MENRKEMRDKAKIQIGYDQQVSLLGRNKANLALYYFLEGMKFQKLLLKHNIYS